MGVMRKPVVDSKTFHVETEQKEKLHGHKDR